ncbi:unnamed protein product [Caenorhabditis brenneri]
MLFFENRYNYLVRHDSESPSRTKKRAVVYFVNYLLAILCVIIMFQGIKNTEGYREIALQKLPCLPARILEKRNFFMQNVDVSIALPFVLISIILFFENRYNYLVRHDSESPSRNKKRAVVYFVNYLLAILCVIIMFQSIKNTEGYREIALQKLPCLPARILEKPDFFMLKMDIFITIFCICTYAVIILGQVFFYFTYTSHYLFRTKAQSTRTSQLQKKFFKSLCVQISVLMFAFFTPCMYFLYTIFTSNFDLVLANFGMLVLCSHGLVSTTVMLLAHKPYREATLDIFGFKGRSSVNAASFIVAKPSISNVK